MVWWPSRWRPSRSRAGNPGSDARQRRLDGDESVLRAFATRTVRDTWTVDVTNGLWVRDGFGAVRFRVQAGSVEGPSGEPLCAVRQVRRHDLPSPDDRHSAASPRPGPAETASLVVRSAPDGILIARLRATSTGPVIALLLPDDGSTPSPRRHDGERPSPRTSLDRPWAESARALAPLSYHATLVADGEVDGRLCDFSGRTLLTDRRRYVRQVSGHARASLREWSMRLLENPLPDGWLLGLLYGTLLVSPVPVAERDSL